MTIPWSELQKNCNGARDAIIASPYIKENTLSRVLNSLAPNASIVCVTNWKPADLLIGVSDVNCRPQIIQRGGSFRLHPRLHAKFYRFGTIVLIGSANLTSSGMGYGNSANLEILCQPSKDFDEAAFERELIAGSRPMDDREFEDWCAIARLPPADTPPVAPMNRYSDWHPETRNPEHVWLVYAGSHELIPSLDEIRLAQSDLLRLGIPLNLDRAAFDMWVRCALLASSAVADVRKISDMTTNDAWNYLSRAWSMSKADASRNRATVEYWMAAFFDR